MYYETDILRKFKIVKTSQAARKYALKIKTFGVYGPLYGF